MLNDEQILLKTAKLLENFDISGKKPEKLLRELDDIEMEAIEDVLDNMKGEDLAFNSLFNGDMRKVIDFPTMDNQSELGQFAEELDRVLKLNVDWEKGMVSAQREWTENSIENDEKLVASIMGHGMGGEGPKKVNRKFQMKIGKYFAKLDKLLQDYKKMRRKIAHEVWEGRNDNAWTASFSIGQIKDSLSTDELKRLYQIQNGLELYAGTDSIAGLNRYYTGYDESQKGNHTKMPQLAKYWQENAGYIKKEIGNLTNDKYSIIISRHPVDVMRMSDFDKISSCHSPPSRAGSGQQYYKCAVAEARGHGAVVYVVETEDLLQATNTGNIESAEQEIQDGELFRDDKRPMVSGPLEPYTRGRLRQVRYYDSDEPKRWDDGTEIAMPEKRIYGANIPGFTDKVVAWARESQESTLASLPQKDNKINLDRFYLFGGSYEDTGHAAGRRALMAKLLGMRSSIDFTGDMRQNTHTEDALDVNAISGIVGRYRNEVEQIQNEWNDHYAAVGVDAAVEEDGEGGVYIDVNARITFEYDIEEFSSLPNSYPTGMFAFDNINDIYGDIFDTDSGFVNKFSNTTVHIGCRFNLNHPDIGESALMYDPDGFNDFCQELDKLDDKRDGYKYYIDEFLKREGYLEGGVYLTLAREIEDGEMSSYEWDVRYDGEYEESYESTAAVSHDFNPGALGVSPQVLFQILDSRDWSLFIREELLKRPREDLGVEYYLDIGNSSAVASGEDIKYTIEFKITADDPDARVELFRELVTGVMDDEDVLNNLFDWAMKQMLNARLPAGQQQDLNEHLVKTWKRFLSR